MLRGCLSGVAEPALFPIDSNGNLTSKTEGTDNWVYTWNAENQLVKVEKNGAEAARFSYDPLARRVEKVAGVLTRNYTYDGADILREARGAGTLKYIHGPLVDEPLAVDDSAVLSFLHADGLQSIVKVTSAAGAVMSGREYDVWGHLQAGESEPGYAFTGREWDAATHLYYYRARYYDPATGRFVSNDPLSFLGGMAFQQYVGNNPTSWIDPTGAIKWRYDHTTLVPCSSGEERDYCETYCRSKGGVNTCKVMVARKLVRATGSGKRQRPKYVDERKWPPQCTCNNDDDDESFCSRNPWTCTLVWVVVGGAISYFCLGMRAGPGMSEAPAPAMAPPMSPNDGGGT